MAKKIALGVLGVLVLLIGGLLATASMQPDEFKLERSRDIAAAPDAIWTHLADFSKWKAWSPWDKLDPNQTTTITGTVATIGHTSAWSGNSDVGKGQMVLNKIDAPKELGIDLTFIEPFAAHNLTTFVLTPDGAKTKVTWSMSGKNDLMGKVFGLFMDMDKMVGKDFEDGLANLDGVVTGKAAE